MAAKSKISIVPKKKKRNSVELGRDVLRAEAEAILGLTESLGENFEQAVEMILALPVGGRVVVSGMGKAGIVGMKISATFAGTGTPSFYLHPAEATHGDLGRFVKGDLALLLSNSGETAEILKIVGAIKRSGCPIVSITAKADSHLAKHSEVVLKLGKLDEVGPLGLAPTTSTTAMLALGDALAMAVLDRRDLTKEEFALYHPGGSLGRQLMTVGEVMRKGEQHAVVKESLLTKEVIHIISTTPGRPGAASVVDNSGKLTGIFTDGNIRRCIDEGDQFLKRPVAEVMGKGPITVSADILVQEALHIMSERKIDQLIVVDDNNIPEGMVDIQDVVGARVI